MCLHGLVVFVNFVADVAGGSSVFVGGFAATRGRRDAHVGSPRHSMRTSLAPGTFGRGSGATGSWKKIERGVLTLYSHVEKCFSKTQETQV